MKFSAEMAVVLAALLTAIASIVVAIITSHSQHKKFLAEIDKQNALVLYRLQQLENKVNAHNNFDSRLIMIETEFKDLKERLKSA